MNRKNKDRQQLRCWISHNKMKAVARPTRDVHMSHHGGMNNVTWGMAVPGTHTGLTNIGQMTLLWTRLGIHCVMSSIFCRELSHCVKRVFVHAMQLSVVKCTMRLASALPPHCRVHAVMSTLSATTACGVLHAEESCIRTQ